MSTNPFSVESPPVHMPDPDQLRELRAQAERCRRLAQTVDDKSIRSTLARMAAEYDDQAGSLGG